MKKTLLLAGVACLFSVSANAMDLSREFRPYIGLDYVYSHADYKDMVREPKKSYNSGAVNVGTWITPYASLEAFFQRRPMSSRNAVSSKPKRLSLSEPFTSSRTSYPR